MLQYARRFPTGILLVMLFSLVVPAHAQFNSSVEGTVSDQTGAVVSDAQVTLHSGQTGIDLTTKTQGTGYYRFNAVGPGDYTIEIQAKGFANSVTATHVNQDQVDAVNVTLALPGASSTVSVTGAVNALNPDETRVQTTLESDQIQNLPLQNGSILETVRIAPGVTGIDEDRDLWAVSIGNTTMNAQANGRPSGSNSYQLDGVSIEDNSRGGTALLNFVPNEDMVQEVALEVNSYSVDSGSSSSMKVNITTKGGTNDFHGTFGDRYSGRGLNAIADFQAPALPNSRRWYTASVGGPIWKDHTFFFFSYLHQTQITALANMQHWTTNDFTTSWAPANYPNSINVQRLLVPFPVGNASNGQSGTVVKQGVTAYAKDLFGTSDPSVCQVPVYSMNSIYWQTQVIGETPIDCGMEIVDQGAFNQTPRVNGFELNGRLDQYFRDGKDRFYGAYLLEPQMSDFLWWRPGFNSTTPSGTRYLNFNYTHIFTPYLVNQVAFGATRYYFAFTSSPANVIPFLSLMIGGGDDATDYFGTPAAPGNTKEHDYQLRDDVTWTHGRHNLKAGFSFAREDEYANEAGWMSKPEDPLYFGWSDLFDDKPFSYSLDTISGTTGKFLANIQGAQVNQFGLYAQDDWKIRPNLLVTFGLRWDDYGNPSAYGKSVLPYLNINFPAGSTLRTNIINNNVSTKQVSNAFTSSQNMNFLPRVGFSWSPSLQRKIKVSGGIGLYEDAMNVSGSISGLSINSPSYLNEAFGVYNAAPLNNVDSHNLYGTDPNAAPPFGNTYSYPVITPVGVDSHGEIILNMNGANTVLTSSLSGVDPKLKPQKTSLYNVLVEKEFTGHLIAGAGYSGSFSWGQYANGDYNSYPGDQIANNGTEKRLSPEWAGVSFNTNLLNSNYNALLLTARQNLNRLSWQASFTWAKTLAHGGVINDIYDPNHYYGPASGSVPKSFNASAQYELPGRNLHNFVERAVLAGWEVSGTATAQAGGPFSFTTSEPFVPLSKAPVSEGGSCVPSASSSCTDIYDPRQAGGFLANGYTGSLVNVPAGLNRKGFSRAEWKYGILSSLGYTFASTPATGGTANVSGNAAASGFPNSVAYGVSPFYSNQGYNSFYGPGYLGIDGALHKKVLLPWFGERKGSTLTLGIEGSNIINRVNLTGPASTDLGTTSSFGLGVSQGANQARMLQILGKFQF